MQANEITEAVIGSAIEVHRALGPNSICGAWLFGWNCRYR
jgi:hypothetical protein